MPRPGPPLRTRPSKRAPPTPTAGAFSSFALKLNREDGDQFLGHAQLHHAARPDRQPARPHLLPRRGDRRGGQHPRAQPSRPHRAARQALKSAPPTSPPAPAPTPSTPPASSTSPVPSRAPRSRLVVVTPALAGPYDYGTVVVRVALHIDPARRPRHRRLRSGPRDHRRHPPADPLDPGQHQQAPTS